MRLFGEHFGDGFPDTPAGGEEECGGGDAESSVPEFSWSEAFVGDISAEVDGGVAEHGEHHSLSESGDTNESDGFRNEQEGEDADEWETGGDPADKFRAGGAFVVI